MSRGVLCVFVFAYGLAAQPPEPGVRFEREIVAHAVGVEGGQAPLAVEFIAQSVAIEGQTVKQAPYSAEAVTETVQALADGNRITRKNTTQLCRDSEGRTRRHEKIAALGPWAANESREIIFIHDNVAGVNYVLEPEGKTARKTPMPKMMRGGPGGGGPPAGGTMTWEHKAPPGGEDVVVQFTHQERASKLAPDRAKTESLGKRNIEGLVCEGTRAVMTIPAGEIGNERPIEVVSERWYSPELKLTVMSKRTDPRFGETTYRLANVQRGDPPRYLFEVPADYTVKEAKAGPEVRVLKRVKEKE